jgi:release factor glutamine methyltransferase
LRIDDAIIWAEISLVKSESPRLDAQLLLAHVLDKQTVYLMTWPEKVLTREQKSQFEALVEQRVNGKPVAHLTGIRGFWSFDLKVNDSTLIPRPDTEILVETALQFCKSDSRILDLGTGSGAIILALASEFNSAECIGVDFSYNAVKLAQENLYDLRFKNVTILQSNWFENVQGLFDIIVSNPPYIDENDHHLDQGDVRFEPISALVSGKKGLADIELIIAQAKDHLKQGAPLLIEHGFDQGVGVQSLFKQYNYHSISTVKDYGQNDRVTFAFYT